MNSTKVLSLAASCGVFLFAALAVVTLHAATIVPPATGWGVSVPPGGSDSNWEVVALPTLFAGASTPYPALVFAGTGPGTVPLNWLGGANNAGVAGAHWIGVRNVADSLFPSGPVNPGGTPPQANYNMIYRYTFTQSVAGPADFAFWAAADNELTFYLNGTITADAMSPSIVGGTQIGALADGFGKLHSFTGTGSVIAGTNHLYAVVTDKWNDDGVVGTWGYTGLLVSPVPEPAGLMLAASGAAAIAAVRFRQRSNLGHNNPAQRLAELGGHHAVRVADEPQAEGRLAGAAIIHRHRMTSVVTPRAISFCAVSSHGLSHSTRSSSSRMSTTLMPDA